MDNLTIYIIIIVGIIALVLFMKPDILAKAKKWIMDLIGKKGNDDGGHQILPGPDQGDEKPLL